MRTKLRDAHGVLAGGRVVCGVLMARVGVEGVRVCVNEGAVGQMISHVHIHVTQRRSDDAVPG